MNVMLLWALLSMAPQEPPAPANHVAVVQQAKADLEAAGVDLSDHNDTTPCGPFQITALAAWRLRAEGAGLFSKAGGTRCEWPEGSGHFYTKDVIAYASGWIVDVVGGGATDHEATWFNYPYNAADLARYVPAFEMTVPGQTDPGPIVVPPANGDLDALLSLLGEHDAKLSSLRAYIEAQVAALRAEHAAALEQGAVIGDKVTGSTWSMVLKYVVLPALTALGAKYGLK